MSEIKEIDILRYAYGFKKIYWDEKNKQVLRDFTCPTQECHVEHSKKSSHCFFKCPGCGIIIAVGG